MLSDDWRPSPGQVALLELPGHNGGEPMTGLVRTGGPQPVIDFGAGLRLPAQRCDVVASFFATDGLYRLEATATTQPAGAGLVQLAVHAVDRVQRRAHTRKQQALPVKVTAPNGRVAAVTGETVDLAPGGARLTTREPLPADRDARITIDLPDGQSVVALASILEAIEHSKGFQYRISFNDIEDRDRDRLLDLTRRDD